MPAATQRLAGLDAAAFPEATRRVLTHADDQAPRYGTRLAHVEHDPEALAIAVERIYRPLALKPCFTHGERLRDLNAWTAAGAT